MRQMNNPFLENNRPTDNTSLNRLKIIDIADIDVDPEVKGKKGLRLMSADNLIKSIKNKSSRLNLDLNKIPDVELPIYLNKALEADKLEVKQTAENIVRRLGRNLAFILLTLKRGDKPNKEARDDWENQHWNYWQQVENIVFAGGLCNGNLGQRLKYYITKIFVEAETSQYNIKIAKNPSLIPMIGAARHSPEKCTELLVFDFGQTLVKRGLAIFEDEELKDIAQLSTLESKYVEEIVFENKIDEKKEAEKLKNYIIKTISNTWKKTIRKDFNPCSNISVSIANDLIDGKFFGGGYGKLGLLSDNLQQEISEKVSDQIGRTINISFIHDGTAAADAYAETDNSVMLSFGTAIGVGFPIEKPGLRAVADDLL